MTFYYTRLKKRARRSAETVCTCVCVHFAASSGHGQQWIYNDSLGTWCNPLWVHCCVPRQL